MDIKSGSHEKEGLFTRGWLCCKALPKKLIAKVVEVCKYTKKLGQDDPRKVIHSLKVGLALTLVSLFYFVQPLFNSFGVSAMWAVITVVIVFEFYVGATIGKGFNRGVATLLAGALGVGAHQLGSLSGKNGEPIVLGLFVFVQGAASTFIRFFPKIKARYDYGLLIFILTFSLVSVSGFRDDEVLELAQKRLSRVAIGACICVILSIFICPVWAGEDLHTRVAVNIEKLGNFLEGFGDEYFETSEDGVSKGDKSFLQDYKSVLNSRNIEETLANFARWEPGHGQFMYRHPWKQYLKIGSLTQQCAYHIEALNGYLDSQIQTPPEIRRKIQGTCTKLSLETGKALKELALAIKTMTPPSSADSLCCKLKNCSPKSQSLAQIRLVGRH
ncbi:hypothetical protein F0562_022383 [Nyssa sinensis]|uniref:Aluminum-activated malate transporter n=1 Tax=Nyssa sinensis TaxID=561372 RepID=A0A5J5BNF4_9ASTE|nr:hypothetical protein F0562_022383 [Nyssa sinensis]